MKKTILVSRSVYDSFAYVETYYQLGKISRSEYEIIKKIKDNYSDVPNTVILKPSVEVIMTRLKKRRDNKERPEREQIFKSEDEIEFVSLPCMITSKNTKTTKLFYILRTTNGKTG